MGLKEMEVDVSDVSEEVRDRLERMFSSATASWITDGVGEVLLSDDGPNAVVVAEHYIPPRQTLDSQAEEMREANLGRRRAWACYYMILLRGRTKWIRADSFFNIGAGTVVDRAHYVTRDGWCMSYRTIAEPGEYRSDTMAWGGSTWVPCDPPLRYELALVRLAAHHEHGGE